LPPPLTRFPYTTLFRSDLGEDRLGALAHLGEAEPAQQARHHDVLERAELREQVMELEHEAQHVVAEAGQLVGRLGEHVLAAEVQDRKSTRLNSSHVKIS